MKKLLKEVWKSFKNSKIILIGLILLIFLSSGVITLIFDIVNSYKSQYSKFIDKSVKHDITMNTDIDIYGEGPQQFYETPSIAYNNSSYLLNNQWEYKEKENYVSTIYFNTDSEFYNLSTLIPNYNKTIYVKTKDLSNLISTNYNFNNPSFNLNNAINNKLNIQLNKTGNNHLETYEKNNNGEYLSRNQIFNILSEIYDVYDPISLVWTNSKDAKKLYDNANNNFVPIVIDLELNEAYLESSLLSNTQSLESIKYSNPNNKNLFYKITSDQIGDLLGFKKSEFLGKVSWKLDHTKTWILDGDINSFAENITPQNFFALSTIPQIKASFKLPFTINNISDLSIPTSIFVYSQYQYIFTQNKYYLAGIDRNQNNQIDSKIWKGYLEEWLNYIKENDPTKFNELLSWTYWTKKIIINYVDINGNLIPINDGEGNSITNPDGTDKIKSFNFDVDLTEEDLTKPIKNSNGELNTIKKIENYNDNNLSVLLNSINKDKSLSYKDQIYETAKNYKYKQIYNNIKQLAQKIGIRETLTVNTNSNNENNVYQFINLGNSNNEINWNGIPVQGQVGKLIDTPQDHEIFSLPSNINVHSNQVPIEYVSPILQCLLNGMSLNRDYINPTLSFSSFTYINNNLETKLQSKKIIWLTKNGQKDLKNIYGISSIVVNNETHYFILKSVSDIDNISWSLHPDFSQPISYAELEKFILNNRLNFAPFDWYGNNNNVVGSKGWARQDDIYIDKYSIPFQYLLPNADLVEDYNNAESDPNSALNNPNNNNGKYGMEIFRDNLIRTLTLVVKPLITPSDWEILMNAVNTGFSKYGFGKGLTPPPQLSTEVYVKVVIGILRDAIVSTKNNLFDSIFGSIFDGLNRYINPTGSTPIQEQQAIFNNEIDKVFNIVKLSTGSVISFDPILNLVNSLTGMNYTKISEIVTNPSNFLISLKELMSSINLDKTIEEFWNHFYINNFQDNQIIGFGDFFPFLYKNIYSISLFKQSLKDLFSATILNDIKIVDVLEKFKPILPPTVQPVLPLIKPLLGQNTLPKIIDWLNMKEPQEGYDYLIKPKWIINKYNENYNVYYRTINLYNILSLFSININGLFTLELNTLVQENNPNNDIEFIYDPKKMTPLEVDIDLIWYLTNYVFKHKEANNEYEPTLLFNIDVTKFLVYGIESFAEIRDDYNQIVINNNLGNMAIVNQAFLNDNNKEVYSSPNLSNDLNDLSKIEDKYKINVSGVEYVIVGKDFSIDYIYPVIDASNMSVNTKNQALVYVNEYGFNRIKRSNVNSTHEKYFLIKAPEQENIQELQTKLNKLLYSVSGTNNIDKNNMAYLYNESSLFNPERSLRITVIEDMINNLIFIQNTIGVVLVLIISIVIIFVIRRYINSRAKVLGILKAQGYSLWEISLSICLFPLFVSIIGATLGYICGLLSQLSIFNLLSIFWKIPFVTIPFNWITFLLTLVVPIVFLCFLTIVTTFWFLTKNQSISLINGSMEINNSAFARTIKKLNNHTSVKNRFSISLALGSIGKLIALFISTLFTSFITLFFIISYRSFNDSIDKTYSNKNYKYSMKLFTLTNQGGDIQTYYAEPNGTYDINNMLYVPVGNVAEGYTYLSSYFKPGYNEIINKNDANGNLDINDKTTPHILTKSSIDLSVVTGGLDINVWKNLYNAIPESQRASIVNISDKSSRWIEWTQEGIEYKLNNKNYVTKFMNFGTSNEYLTLYDLETGKNYQVFNNIIKQFEDIRIDYFNYYSNEEQIEDSKFIYRHVNDNNYIDQRLIITGEPISNNIRKQYRDFLVQAYNFMLNFDPANININNKLPDHIQTTMPEFQLDYFISPGAVFLHNNSEINENDDTFTYLEAESISNNNLKIDIIGYNENSKNILIKDEANNNLLNQLSSFKEPNIYPLIINNVVAYKYNFKIGDIIDFHIKNQKDRLDQKIKLALYPNIQEPERKESYKFKIVGISDTYINEEWITLQKFANEILKLNDGEYNGIISNNPTPLTLTNILSLYASNGYWSANNKIFYVKDNNEITNLSDSEKQTIINTYRQLFYNINSNGINISLFASDISRLYPELSTNNVNLVISEFLKLPNLDLTFESNNNSSLNDENVQKANSAIQKFVNIYTDEALNSLLLNATSQGIEAEYISHASNTINQGMLIIISISFVISLTILIMVTSMIITENERNIAILSILGYINREKLLMFFSIYVPIVFVSIFLSMLIVWTLIPIFLSSILSMTSILLPIHLSFIHILIAFGIVSFIFAFTCIVSWIIQGRIKPIILLK